VAYQSKTVRHGPNWSRETIANRLQGERVRELAPVGGDHVGRRRQAGRAAELGHHLAAGKTVLGAALVL
jgi:hypothetical protein